MDEEKKAQEIQEQAEREKKAQAAQEAEELAKQTMQPASGTEGTEEKSPLEEARALDLSIKEGTANLKKLFEKNEKLVADLQISGKGFAGGGSRSPTPEEAKTQEALEFWKDTPIADAIKRYG